MEHRWGERFALHLTVELSCYPLPPVAGSLENVSASGAFVRTIGRGPPRGPVEVMLLRRGSERAQRVRLPAYVVRETETGVGIEWCEFAPRDVRELIIRGRHRPQAAAPASTHCSSRLADTATRSLAQPTPHIRPPVLATAAR